MDDFGLTRSPWIASAIVLLCLAISAFCSAAEAALTAASQSRMHALENGGDPRARIVNRLLLARERLIGAMLIGKIIVTIGASAFATSVLMELFGASGVVHATLVTAALIVVFSEVASKTVAVTAPDRTALLLARPASWCVALLGPLAAGVEIVVRLSLRPFGIRIGENQPILSAQEELRGAVALLHREGGVETEARNMLGGLIDLSELEVSDVMVHRTKMRTISADLPPEELVREVLASPYTRLPLWSGSSEDIVGVLHAKDLLRALDAAKGDAAAVDVRALARDPWFVPDTTSLPDQLRAFLARKTHFALVVDEYGEVMGLVTLEDILEEIVGDIKDEHDVAVQGLRPQPDGGVRVDGAVPIRDLNRAMDWALPDEEATTIAGLVIHEARTIPDAGQVFTFHGFRFEVLRKSKNRIAALRITPLGRRRPAE